MVCAVIKIEHNDINTTENDLREDISQRMARKVSLKKWIFIEIWIMVEVYQEICRKMKAI